MKTSPIKIKSKASSSNYLYLSALLTSLLALLLLIVYTDGSIPSNQGKVYQLARIETNQSRRPVDTRNISPSLTLGDERKLSSASSNPLLSSNSSAWPRKFWIMEERKHLPLLFDFNRTNLKPSFEFSNTAFTAVPGNDEHFMVSVRSSSITHVRWGRQCTFGLLDSSTIIKLARNQSLLPMEYPQEPVLTITANFTRISEFSTQEIEQLQPARKKFKHMQRKVYQNHTLYNKFKDDDIWVRPLCVVKGFGIPDVRLFFRRHEEVLYICLISDLSGRIHRIPKAQRIGCLEFDKFEVDNSIMLSTRAVPCPLLEFVYALPDYYDRRNIAPLVERDGMQWGDHDSLTWLMDTMGSASQSPMVFPVKIENQFYSQANDTTPIGPSDKEYELDNCDDMSEWRGNTPITHFTDRLWIAIVHKHCHSEKSRLNRIGRSYINKVVLFQADTPGGLPTKCLPNGPEATGRDIFQKQPILGFEWPFAFVLGLVHLGKIETFPGGERHQFLVSAGLDDSQPAFKIFDIYVPTDAV
jgi:hypothetical protein